MRTTADSYVAYSQKCTHLSCAVYYEAEQQRLACLGLYVFVDRIDAEVRKG